MALGLIGQLVEEASGRPLQGLNVRAYVCGAQDTNVAVGYDTTDDDGSFSLGVAWSDTSPTRASLHLRFDILDGSLTLVHQTEQEVVLEAPDSVVNVTLPVPLSPQPEAEEKTALPSENGVAALRVVPEQLAMALGDRVVLLAEAHDGDGAPVGGVPIEWRAYNADNQEVPISSAGEFVGRMPGVYHIVATAGDQQGAATATVRANYVSTAAASLIAALASQERDVGPRWNDENAASAFALTNRVGQPAAILFSMLNQTGLGVRRDELRQAVTVGTSNYTFSTPIIRLPGRGMDLRLDLTYNSCLWNRGSKLGNNYVYEFDNDQGWPAPGWSLGFGRIIRLGQQGSMLVDPEGTRHPYETLSLTGDQKELNFIGRTTDGTFIDYEHLDSRWPTTTSDVPQRARARYPNGTTVYYSARGHDYSSPTGLNIASWGVLFPTQITDSNGNLITITYRNNIGPEIDTIIDTLGRTIRFHYDSNSGQLTSIIALGLDGTQRTLVRFNLVSRPWTSKVLFSNQDDVIIPAGSSNNVLVMQAIYDPRTHRGYWFGDPETYSAYGMATRITRHRDMGFVDGTGLIAPGTLTSWQRYNYPLAVTSSLTDVPMYTSMTEYWEGMDTPAAVTSFATRPENDSLRQQVTYPNGSRIVTLTSNVSDRLDYGLPNRIEVYDGDRLMQQITNTWQQGDDRSPQLARIERTDERGQMSATEFDYGPNNRVTEVREYEFGGISMLRRTRTEYHASFDYITRHIFSLPTVVEVFNGYQTSPTARTEYVYDSQPLKNTPGVIGHAQTHNPYAPRRWVPPYDEEWCTSRGICHTVHTDGYWETEYVSSTDFRGNVTEIRRYADPAQRREAVVEQRTYDITGNLVRSETGRYERSVYEYTLNTQYGYPTRHVLGPAEPSSAQIVTTATYDFGTGLLVSTTDANGRSMTTSYDPGSLRPSMLTWPTGATTTFDYDDMQLAVTQTTRSADGTLAGQQTTMLNGLGLTRRVVTLAGTSEPGDAEAIYDITESCYDALGRLWKQTRPYRSGQTPFWTEFFRDVLGRVTGTLAADGSETHAYYDEQARPDGASSWVGSTTRLVDAWGRERWMRHNALGQLQEVVDPNPDGNGSVFSPGTMMTYYAYNVLDLVVEIYQPLGNQDRRFRYDGLGRLTGQALPERSLTLNDAGEYQPGSNQWSDVFAYTDGTRLAWQMDARGVRTVFEYGDDALGRLQRDTYELTSIGKTIYLDPASPPMPASAVSYDYVATGDLTRLARVTSDQAVEEYGYDDQGRLASKTLVFTDQQRLSFAVDYGYDTLDRLSSITYPAKYGFGGAVRKQVELQYDLASKASRLTVDRIDQASMIEYSPGGPPTAVTVGWQDENVVEAYDIDPANGLLAAQRVFRGSETLLNLSYSYLRPGLTGVTGQLVSAIDLLDARRSMSYDYDALGRLHEARGGNVDAPLRSQRYTYDQLGNRTDVIASGANLDGSPMPPDGLAGLTFSRPSPSGLYYTNNQVTSPGFAYDEAGNFIRSPRLDGSWQRYHYDAAGRLVSVTDDAGTLLETYTYGSDRRRIRTRNEQTGAQTRYVWHRDTVIAEYEQSATDRRPRWSRALVYLGQRFLCTYTLSPIEPASRRPSELVEVVRYHHPDRLGTRLITTPATGEVMELIALPYGTPLQGDAAAIGSPTFTSYNRSQVTGLDYAVNRHYDPQLGRFLQPDPMSLAAIRLGEPRSHNGYAYGGGDPINRLDPIGLRWREKDVWQDDDTGDITIIGEGFVVEGRFEPLTPGRGADDPAYYPGSNRDPRREGGGGGSGRARGRSGREPTGEEREIMATTDRRLHEILHDALLNAQFGPRPEWDSQAFRHSVIDWSAGLAAYALFLGGPPAVPEAALVGAAIGVVVYVMEVAVDTAIWEYRTGQLEDTIRFIGSRMHD